jgi:hypothetical protein
MKLVYITGPYVGSSYHQTEAYITYARQRASQPGHGGAAATAPSTPA